MSEKTKSPAQPGKTARILSALLAFFLTATLLLALCAEAGMRLMTDRELHTRAALNPKSISLQMERIREGIDRLSREYGFNPEPVNALITRESVEELDRQVIAWWTSSAAEGRFGEHPVYEPEGVEEALRGDQEFLGSLDPMMQVTTIQQAVRRIGDTVMRSAVLFRDALTQAAVNMAGKNVNLPEIMTTLGKIPGLAWLASLLLAGLIALAMSRNILSAGQYIGGAISACGLTWILVMILLHMMNFGGMIREASALLDAQFSRLSHDLTLEGIGIAASLLIIGGSLMILARGEYLARTRQRVRVYYTVRSPKIPRPLTLAVVADLHAATFDDAMEDFRAADAILVPGDLVNRHRRTYLEAARFIFDVPKVTPVFYSLGNHERKCSFRAEWMEMVKDSSVTLLDDESILFEGIRIGGLSSRPKREANQDFLDAFELEGEFKLLMCHHPEVWRDLVRGRDIDFTVCGHAHGGQMQFFGHGLFAPGQGFFPKLTHGVHDGGKMILSRGMTNGSRLPRINNPCELIILHLEPGEEETVIPRLEGGEKENGNPKPEEGQQIQQEEK